MADELPASWPVHRPAGGADGSDSAPPAYHSERDLTVYQWRSDMFRPDLVHLADLTGRLHVAKGRRWVFAVDKKTADVDKPEVPGRTSRCPDCALWAHRHGLAS